MVNAPMSADEAWTLIDRMENYYRATFDGIAEDDAFYEGLLDEFFDPPDGFELTIPTTARAIVDEAVDNATPDDFLITYSPRGKDQKARDDADKVRLWCKHLLLFWRMHGQDIDFIRDFMKNQFKSGFAAFKVTPDFSLWPQVSDAAIEDIKEASGGDGKKFRRIAGGLVKEIKRVRAENTPIMCRSIPPSCIMIDPTTGMRKLWLIERYQSSPQEIQRLYAVDSALFRDGYNASYPVHEVWTASHISWDGRWHQGWHYVFVNWECVRDEENLYDDLPYSAKYSGYGREAYEGKPEYKAVGFFTRALKSMLLAEMRRFTHLDAIMSQIAFPIIFLDQAAEMAGVRFTPGYVNYVPQRALDNIDKMWVSPKIPTADYANNMSSIGAQIERGSVQRALRGVSMSGVDSAQHYNSVNAQAKLRIMSVVSATEQALSVVMSLALRYVDQILRDNVGVVTADDQTQRYTIGPDNIHGHYVVQVKFQPNEEADKERKRVLVNDAITKGGLAPYDAYEMAGFPNPGEMVESRLAAKAMDDPLITRALAKQALHAWGLDAEKLEMEERIADFEKQQLLNKIINAMSIGTGAGMPGPSAGGGGLPGGPVPAPAMPPGMGGAPGGSPPAPQGMLSGGPAPAVQDQSVQSMVSGIGAVNGGP